jgi:hypothetical protein
MLVTKAHGGRVLGPPNNMPWGQRVAHIQDPDGNAVNLTQPISTRERRPAPPAHRQGRTVIIAAEARIRGVAGL